MSARPAARLQLVKRHPVEEALRQPKPRGYAPIYRRGETNVCPGCGRSQWFIGRSSAECAFCHTAVPMDVS